MDNDTLNTDVVESHAISEQDFLLTELRYTIGQLHVQLGGLVSSETEADTDEASEIDTILGEMLRSERTYQERYARQLGLTAPGQRTFEGMGDKDDVEDMRNDTLALLEQVPSDQWSPEVLELMRQQVADDRQFTTRIAEQRKSLFEHPVRPDLLEPLTDQPAPEELSATNGQ